MGAGRTDDSPRALAERCAQEQPELGGSVEGFARHLEGLSAREELRLADLYLAWCCCQGAPAALLRLWREHVPALRQAVTSVVKDEARAEDVLQDVMAELLVGKGGRAPTLATYEGRSKLSRWLRSVGVRAALAVAHKRSANPQPLTPSAAALLPSPETDPELALLKARCGQQLERALQHGLKALGEQERLLLQQHWVDGLTIDQLARLYRIHRATAARRIASAREELLSFVRRRLREQLQLTGRELDSLIELAQSRIPLSVRDLEQV